jgi:sialic acid synthase
MNTRSIHIDGQTIQDDGECFVIAELGHNHQGSVEQCKQLIDLAKRCGANAVKLQKRDNRSLYTRTMFDSLYNSLNAFGATYGEHREFLEFDRDQHRELQDYAAECNITLFSTPFDIPSADFLASLDMPAYKIASADLNNLPLIRHVAMLDKPLLISTGGGDLEQVEQAYRCAREQNPQVALLQCTAGYPPAWDELNLQVIQTYRERFPEAVIGLSTHDSGIAMGPVAYVLGARIIEKHFTLNRAMKGTDHPFSLERSGLEKLVRDLRRTRMALGNGKKYRYASEQAPLYKMGKKIVAATALPAGHRLRRGDLAIKSPNDGLPPDRLDSIIGLYLKHSLNMDDAIRLEYLQREELT